MPDSFAHCGYCGAAYPAGLPAHTRTCQSCGQTSYRNPIPVAVTLVPVALEAGARGLLAIRRSIPPRQGQLALPGGFINLGESWQAGAAREVWEETGLRLEPDGIRLARVLSAPDGTLLIFGLAPTQPVHTLESLTVSSETSEVTVLARLEPLGFALHTQVAEEFFAGAWL